MNSSPIFLQSVPAVEASEYFWVAIKERNHTPYIVDNGRFEAL